MKAMESNEATELLESFSSEHVQIGRAQVKLERLPHPADVTAAGVVAHAKAMGLLWRDAFAGSATCSGMTTEDCSRGSA
jgi:hypothetical protein